MVKSRIGGGWSKAFAVCLLSLLWPASGWEEGDDSVNVISVENLDALLGLRMVTELNLTNLTEQRARRGVRQAGNLCGRPDCDCGTDTRSVSCRFGSNEVLELAPGALSPHHKRLILSNLTELRILPQALHESPHLKFISISDVANVTIAAEVVLGPERGLLEIDISNCNEINLLDHSFSNVRSHIQATIESCDRVAMQRWVFPARLELQIIDVPKLELSDSTFSAEISERGAAEITFTSVSVRTVPSRSFKLNGASITFAGCEIGTIEREAFRALLLQGVHFQGTTIDRIETEAFSSQTGIRDVELSEVTVQYIAGQALSAATNLTIRNSSVREISDGAFNVTAAYLRLTKNRFKKIGRQAFAIQSWNSIVIDGNWFESLNQDSFYAPFVRVDNVTNEFVFSENVVNRTEVNSLTFVPTEDGLDVVVANNTFDDHCHCHMESWMMTLSRDRWRAFYDSSNCKIGEFGACYNLRGEYMNMRDYTTTVCDLPVNADCDAIRVSAPGRTTGWDLKNTERTILGVVLLGVASSVSIMVLILLVTWMRRKGACGKPCFFPRSRLLNDGDLVTTSSISRVNIHEYAEIQYQMTERQKQEEIMVDCEDKATQTLPEELTQELLQSLREKLDDPENYSEARNMIEHLYDLIKVEESCNNNSRTSLALESDSDPDADGNVYDVISRRPRRRSMRVRRVPVTTTGTRVPSPDKLSPVAFHLPRATIITDYAEPRDRKSNEYCELPGSIMPDVLSVPYAVPCRNRPLPSAPSTSKP